MTLRPLACSLAACALAGLAAAVTPACGSSSSCSPLPCPVDSPWDSSRCACSPASDASSVDAAGDATASDGATHDAPSGDATADGSVAETGAHDGAAADGASSDGAVSDGSVTDASGDGAAQAGCLASGGTVGTALCCASESDFPNTCGIGACSCAPSSSHQVAVCTCPSGECFDGTACQ